MSNFFKILKQSKTSRARLGVITTPHGRIYTPAFIPVATQATIKSLDTADLKKIGVQAVLANTYHLHLRPGEDLIKKLGGLHQFMNWSGPLITDSGGFQVFSLGFGLEHGVGKIANIFPEEIDKDRYCKKTAAAENLQPRKIINKPRRLVKIDENGVNFTSHLDGSLHRFTPEISIKIQEKLGADLIFAFDECTSPLSNYQYTKRAMEGTHRWASRCLVAHKRKNQFLFGIIQGGAWQDLRQTSAQFIENLPFDGIGIGGSLGKSKKDMFKIIDWIVPFLKEPRPRHLLGIGQPDDILKAVKKGIDLFDCAYPTRLARHGVFLTKRGEKNILLAKYKKDRSSPVKNCQCSCCQNYSSAYLHHLFKAKEILAHRLATIHNLYFMMRLMEEIRWGIG